MFADYHLTTSTLTSISLPKPTVNPATSAGVYLSLGARFSRSWWHPEGSRKFTTGSPDLTGAHWARLERELPPN